jgi:hypothetical protein
VVVTKRELHLWFHDVPVSIAGPLAEFELAHLLQSRAPGTDSTSSRDREIQIRMLAQSSEPSRGDELSIDEREDGLIVVRDENLEAVVDLAELRIDVRRRFERTDTLLPEARALSTALHLALREHGTVPLHAAAMVLSPTGAIVLAGDSGAGKTTTALALFGGGFTPMTDDQVFLRAGQLGVELLATPAPFRVTDQTLGAFPRLRPFLGERVHASAKHTLHLEPMADRFAGPTRLVFPRRATAGRSRVLAMSSAEALGQLMLASPLVAVGGRSRAMRHTSLLRLLAQTSRPAWLELGSELLEAPERTAADIVALLTPS